MKSSNKVSDENNKNKAMEDMGSCCKTSGSCNDGGRKSVSELNPHNP